MFFYVVTGKRDFRLCTQLFIKVKKQKLFIFTDD